LDAEQPFARLRFRDGIGAIEAPHRRWPYVTIRDWPRGGEKLSGRPATCLSISRSSAWGGGTLALALSLPPAIAFGGPPRISTPFCRWPLRHANGNFGSFQVSRERSEQMSSDSFPSLVGGRLYRGKSRHTRPVEGCYRQLLRFSTENKIKNKCSGIKGLNARIYGAKPQLGRDSDADL